MVGRIRTKAQLGRKLVEGLNYPEGGIAVLTFGNTDNQDTATIVVRIEDDGKAKMKRRNALEDTWPTEWEDVGNAKDYPEAANFAALQGAPHPIR
jgi:hypothetical protein